MVQYLLNATAIWLTSIIAYDVFLKKESYHGYNRFYLLFTFLLGLLLPLLLSQADITRYGASIDKVVSDHTEWTQWILIAYGAGAFVSLSFLVADTIKLFSLYRSGAGYVDKGWSIIETNKAHPPFSFLDTLFVTSKDQYTVEEWNMILTHEKQHSILLHVVDMLILQLTRIVFWFHPLVYMYHNRLLLIHEYQADQASSLPPDEYGRFLIEQAVLQAAPVLSQSFNRSPIKNRIVMLNRNRSPRTGKANLKLLLVLPLTLFCLFFFAKNSYSLKPGNTVWKKQVARVIDMSVQEDTVVHHLRDMSPDTTLTEILVNAIRAGKITAYANTGNFFSEKLTKDMLEALLSSKPDTVSITDPVTSQEMIKIVSHDFNYEAINKYRIIEDWTFDPNTGKTQIQITGIAPIRDVYGSAGEFRGVMAMFYLRFNDVKNIISRYELYHPNNTIASHVWNDYFTAGDNKTK